MKSSVTKERPKFEMCDGKIVTKGYGYIATSVMDDETITRGAKILYVYLTCKAGISDSCYPSNTTIRESLGIKSKLTLRDYKDELIIKGLLKVEARAYKSGQNTSNYYFPTKMTLSKDQ